MLTTIIATIFVLGVLIFFHELGHFLVAKRAGIRVEKFSLGFPPTLISKKMGETTYAIGVIPLGGYVKMAGDNPAENLTGKPWEFMSKPPWKRFFVISAGPFMNFVLAVLILAGLFFFRGEELQQAYISDILPDGPAEAAGIAPGDYIVSVDGIEVNSTEELINQVKDKIEEPIVVGWMHNEQLKSDTIVTFRDYSVSASGDTIAVGKIGITLGYAYQRLGLFASIEAGFDRAVFYTWKTIEFVGGFFSGKSKANEVGGPIFIARIAGATARAGIDILLEFMALLSVNLAVLNILPIPIFDGGHLVFLAVEKLKGSPPSLKIRLIAQQIGIAFILLLVIFITFNDITR
jgi:regulator of sigma E protease